jgi:hypothetical protein
MSADQSSEDEIHELRRREYRAVRLRREQAQRQAWGGQGAATGLGMARQEASSTTVDRSAEQRKELVKLDLLDQYLMHQLERVCTASGAGQKEGLAIVDRILDVAERRSRLVGADAPRQREQAVISERQLKEAITDMDSQVEALERSQQEGCS